MLLILLMTGPSAVSVAAVRFSNLDFWYFESFENEELRGGPSIQLNTRPLVRQLGREEPVGFLLNNIVLEYAESDGLPQIENRQGNWMTRGQNTTLMGEFGYIGESLTLWFQPALSDHENSEMEDGLESGTTHPTSGGNLSRIPEKEGRYTSSQFRSAYLLTSFFNWYLFLGKDSLRFGAGKHDTLHLSDSAEPFPMIRLGTVSPADTAFGYFSFLTYVGELESDRHIPRAKFAGTRLNWSTDKRLEIGISRSWFAGGDGQNNSFSHVYWDLYTEFFKPREGAERYSDYRNQQLVFDFRFKVPELSLVFYGEFGREDHEHDLRDSVYKWDRTHAHILGIKQIDLFDGFFWIVEKANTVQPAEYDDAIRAWYNHHEYRNGWTYRGVGLGHHLGADSTDIFYALGYQSPNLGVMVFYDEEIHGVRSLPDEETETKTEIGLKGFALIRSQYRIEYSGMKQQYHNYGTEPGKSIETNLFSVSLEVLF